MNMDGHTSAGKMSRTSSMIQVDVREAAGVQILHLQPMFTQGAFKGRHRVPGAGLDENVAGAVGHEVGADGSRDAQVVKFKVVNRNRHSRIGFPRQGRRPFVTGFPAFVHAWSPP